MIFFNIKFFFFSNIKRHAYTQHTNAQFISLVLILTNFFTKFTRLNFNISLPKKNSTMTWNDHEIATLIRERKERNEEYWNIAGTDRVPFWDSVASKINIEFTSSYTVKQCREKF